QGLEYWTLFQRGVTVGLDLFATTFFTLTGFHGLHVCMGLIALMIVLGVAFARAFKKRPLPALGPVGLYWHFVDVVWVLVFSIVSSAGSPVSARCGCGTRDRSAMLLSLRSSLTQLRFLRFSC